MEVLQVAVMMIIRQAKGLAVIGSHSGKMRLKQVVPRTVIVWKLMMEEAVEEKGVTILLQRHSIIHSESCHSFRRPKLRKSGQVTLETAVRILNNKLLEICHLL